jgi:dienelactone hydrolase
MSQFKLLISAAVATLLLSFGFAASASAAPTLLPAPTGQYNIGERTVFLPDPARSNRQVQAQLWYPTSTTSGAVSRYLSQNATYDQNIALALTKGLEGKTCYAFFGSVSCMGVAVANTMYPRINQRDTHAFLNAPIRTDLGQLPVVLLSPGFGMPSYLYSAVSENLASHGYIVVSTSVTGESIANEVSNGVAKQTVTGSNQAAFNQRIADYRFMMNKLSTLPNGVGAQVDMTRIGGGGHSWGGYTAVETAYSDPRILAIANLDGTPGWPANSAATNMAMNNGIPQPILRLQGANSDIPWNTYASHPHGPLYQLVFANTGHTYFSDVCYTGIPTHQSNPLYCGNVDPNLTMDAINTYTLAFFNKHVLGQPTTLLDGPSPQFPNVTFMP